ncbi:HEAT repeat domain-containing protein, partial [Desulfobulbus sp. TB]|nr:HEAT repeat domain-containing protein [Desulfobulbus sp. TB]
DSSVAFELAKLLVDEDKELWRAAAEALVMLGNSSVVQDLVKLLKDENWYVRGETAGALGTLGDSSVASELTKLLADKNEYVREGAARALGRLGDSSVVPELVKLLVDENADVRSSAAEALGNLKAETVATILSRYLKIQKMEDTAAKALLRMHQSSPELQQWQEEQFKTAQERIEKKIKKQEAAEALGFVFTEEAVTLLTNLLTDANQNVVKAAVASLGNIGEHHPDLVQAQTEKLLKLTESPNFNIQRSAITALGQLISFQGKKKAADLPELEKTVYLTLRTILFNEQGNLATRLAALDALGATGRYGEELFNFLKKRDQDKDESLRYRSLLWLGRMAYTDAHNNIEDELEELGREKADWRKERDSKQEKSASYKLETKDRTWKKEHWEYVLGNALARIAPETTGINLLNHPLYQVRQGAIRALASRIADGADGAALIGKIIQAHQDFDPDDLPSPFPYAAFQAIDLALWNLEYSGKEEDVKVLQNIRDKLQPCQIPGQDGAIRERLEWTIDRLAVSITNN